MSVTYRKGWSLGRVIELQESGHDAFRSNLLSTEPTDKPLRLFVGPACDRSVPCVTPRETGGCSDRVQCYCALWFVTMGDRPCVHINRGGILKKEEMTTFP